MTGAFEPGSVVVLREVLRGRVWAAKPVVVVEDSAARFVAYLANGTPLKLPGDLGGRLRHGKAPAWTLVDGVWDGEALIVTPAGTAHAVLLLWPAGRAALRSYYVNLQSPLRRTALGFDFLDHDLDLVIAPDLASWTWKDEDDLAAAVDAGVFSRTEAASVRAEGERVLARLAAGEWPYTAWAAWSPEPGWPVPALPDGWDVIEELERT